jgi:IS30 family transposase
MPANPLTALDREEIRAGIARGDTDGQIAARLGRHRTTINREINRNGGRNTYRATAAQSRADRCRARPKTAMLAGDRDLCWQVTKRLLAGDSPMTIAVEVGRATHGYRAKISHETIYQAVYQPARSGLPAQCCTLVNCPGSRGSTHRPMCRPLLVSDRRVSIAG